MSALPRAEGPPRAIGSVAPIYPDVPAVQNIGPAHGENSITIKEGQYRWQLEWREMESLAELKQRIVQSFARTPKDQMQLHCGEIPLVGNVCLDKGDTVTVTS